MAHYPRITSDPRGRRKQFFFEKKNQKTFIPFGCEDNGFTVIELMVALVILALGVVALTGALSDSVFRATHAEKEAVAVRLAEAWLARLGADQPVIPGITSGQAAGISWTLQIVPYGSDTELAAWPVKPASVTLTLEWPESGHRHVATWHTMGVMAPPKTAP